MRYILATILFSISICLLSAQQYIDQTLMHDGKTREYRIYIPADYDGSIKVPLMFNFHGGNGDIDSQIAIADMSAIADTANFFVVYPQASADPNDGGSANWLHKDPSTADDIFFVEKMIDAIAAVYEIDQNRVYACGYSLGGEFSYELACRLNHKIAAIGAVARTMNTFTFDKCQPVHPTGIMTILGTDDSVSPYDGLTWNGIQYYLSADEMHGYWTEFNLTSTLPSTTQIPDINTSDKSTVERIVWKNGEKCVSVEHLKVIGGGHDWPGSFGNMDIDATLEIWNYVSNYDLTGFINCDMVSISETEIEKSIHIYPNPTSDFITIKTDDLRVKQFQVFSLLGELVMRGMIDESGVINFSELNSGVYFLSFGNKAFKIFKI